jgi:hypothetical protein
MRQLWSDPAFLRNLPDPSPAGVGEPFEFDPAAVSSVVNTVKQTVQSEVDNTVSQVKNVVQSVKQTVESGIDRGIGVVKDIGRKVQQNLTDDVSAGGIGEPDELDPKMFDPQSQPSNDAPQQSGDLTKVPLGEMTEFPEAMPTGGSNESDGNLSVAHQQSGDLTNVPTGEMSDFPNQ